MADKRPDVNNLPPTPQKGQVGETDAKATQSQKADKQPSRTIEEELKALEETIALAKNKPNVQKPPEDQQKPPEDKKTQEDNQEIIPEDLLKKTPEELAKMYYNLQKKFGEHSNELGQLRKYREEQERLKQEIEKYQVSTSAQHLINKAIDKMSPEDVNGLLERFANNPKSVIASITQEIMQPFILAQAKYNNQIAEMELRENTKDDLVPYSMVEKEVRELLSKTDKNGRNEYWDRYGSKAFEKAYQDIKLQKYPEIVKQREEKIVSEALKRAEEELRQKYSTYTASQGAIDRTTVGRKVDYGKLPPEEAIEAIEKLLGHTPY